MRNKEIIARVNVLEVLWRLKLVEIKCSKSHAIIYEITRISDKLPTKEMSLDITRIRSKSAALKPLCRE